MATTGTVLAKNMKLYVGSTAITCQVDASITCSTEVFDTTCKDSGANAAFLPGTKSWTGSVTGNLAFDATYGWSDLYEAWDGQTSLSIVFQNAVSGDESLAGSAYITNLETNSAGNDAAVTFSCDFQGTGALVKATIS